MLAALIKMFTGAGGLGAIEGIIEQIGNHKRQMAAMELESDKLAHEEAIARLEKIADVLIEEQKHVLTSWIRPAFAFVALVYFAKVLLWDLTFGLGSTPAPQGIMEWTFSAIIGFYFLTRPFEKYLGSK